MPVIRNATVLYRHLEQLIIWLASTILLEHVEIGTSGVALGLEWMSVNEVVGGNPEKLDFRKRKPAGTDWNSEDSDKA